MWRFGLESKSMAGGRRAIALIYETFILRPSISSRTVTRQRASLCQRQHRRSETHEYETGRGDLSSNGKSGRTNDRDLGCKAHGQRGHSRVWPSRFSRHFVPARVRSRDLLGYGSGRADHRGTGGRLIRIERRRRRRSVDRPGPSRTDPSSQWRARHPIRRSIPEGSRAPSPSAPGRVRLRNDPTNS